MIATDGTPTFAHRTEMPSGSPHAHRTVVPGCFRCELGGDEARSSEIEQIYEVLCAEFDMHPDAARHTTSLPRVAEKVHELFEAWS